MLAGDDAFAIIEPVWYAVDIYHSLFEYQSSLRVFSHPQRLVLAIHWYIAEVNNGGHEQFYDNSTGIVWPDAAAGFDAIHLSAVGDIIRESSRRLGMASRDREERGCQMEELQPSFADLDDRFYTLQDSVSIDTLILEYARRHAPSFYFEGIVQRPVFST